MSLATAGFPLPHNAGKRPRKQEGRGGGRTGGQGDESL